MMKKLSKTKKIIIAILVVIILYVGFSIWAGYQMGNGNNGTTGHEIIKSGDLKK
jgi:hypothetical protein